MCVYLYLMSEVHVVASGHVTQEPRVDYRMGTY